MFGKRNNIVDFMAIVFLLTFFVCGVLVSLHRYWQFDVFYYDFGIFNQAIWNVSQFKLPIIDHFIVPGKVIFADHFSPSIFILSPLYWFTDRAEVLLIAQSLFVSSSGIILYIVGFQLLKDKLSSFLIMVSYFSFVGLQNSVITDFHELTILTPFLSFLYLCYVTKRKWLFIILVLIILGFKESLFTFGIGLGIFVFFSRREWRIIAILIFFFSLFWALLTIKYIIPFFSLQPYYYSPELSLPIFLADSGMKIKTLLYSFSTYILLPLGAIWLYPIYILHFATRFFSERSTRWGLGLHYSAEIAPTLAFGALIYLQQIKKVFPIKYIRMISLLSMFASLFIFRFILHGPFLLAINPAFYNHTKDFAYLENLIKRIPSNVSISAQNNLAIRFFKQSSFILTDDYKRNNPEVILLDLRPGQNPNNFLGIKNEKTLFERIKADKKYTLYYHEGDQYIFKKLLK